MDHHIIIISVDGKPFMGYIYLRRGTDSDKVPALLDRASGRISSRPEDRFMNAPGTSQTAAPWKYLERNPNSAYRQLFIKGTRIRARVLYGQFLSEEEPRTPEQIAADYALPIEAVREAIAYCQANPPEIEDDFRREEALMAATGMNDPDYKYHGRPKILTAQEMARIDGK